MNAAMSATCALLMGNFGIPDPRGVLNHRSDQLAVLIFKDDLSANQIRPALAARASEP